jgi:hypothetical protein
MNIFGLSATQIDSAGAHWTAREVLQQPRIWAQIETLITGESARLFKEFLAPPVKARRSAASC